MAKDTKPKITAQQAKILASLGNIQAVDAIQIASARILETLGEKPEDLLLAKAAQYTEMAQLLQACRGDEEEYRTDEKENEADEASAADEEETDDEEEEEDAAKIKAKPKTKSEKK